MDLQSNGNKVEVFLPTEINEETFKALLPDFFDEIEADFELLKNAAKNKELKELRLLAHKIKGTSATYGAQLISEAALSTQFIIDQNKLEELDSACDQLEKAIEATLKYAQLHML